MQTHLDSAAAPLHTPSLDATGVPARNNKGSIKQ